MPRAGLIRLMALVALLLVLGAAACAFDHDDTGDLCLISLAIFASALALSPLLATARLDATGARTHRCLLADRPSPPPRF
jgi:hypothetical protein